MKEADLKAIYGNPGIIVWTFSLSILNLAN